MRGLGAQAAGLLLVAQPLVQAAVSPFAGRLSDRVAPRTLASAGMAVIVCGLASLSFLDARTSMAGVAGWLGVLGVGFGLFSSPNTSAVMGSVDRAHYGVASATLATMRMTGQAFSMGIAMLVFSLAAGSGASGAACSWWGFAPASQSSRRCAWWGCSRRWRGATRKAGGGEPGRCHCARKAEGGGRGVSGYRLPPSALRLPFPPAACLPTASVFAIQTAAAAPRR